MAESGAESGKKVEVRFGAFSCSIEGYDNPVEQMREVLLLMQGMIRETPALADHGPGFGEAEVARIEHALDRRAERQAGGPGIVVIRGPEATRTGDDDAEDAVTTAEIPPGSRRLAEDGPEAALETAPEPFPEIAPEAAPEPAPEPAGNTDEQPQVAADDAAEPEDGALGATSGIFAAPVAEDTTADRAADDQASDGQARVDDAGAETDDGQPERPLDDETGAAPAAAAIFSAPAAALAEAAFSADLAGTGEPEADARTALVGEADEATADADRASHAGAGTPAEAGQPGMAADAEAAEHPDAPAAPAARAEEANHLWDAVDAALPEFEEGPAAEAAPVHAPARPEAPDETARPAGASRTDEPATDVGQPDPFAFEEAAGVPDEPQAAAADRQPDAEAGEDGRAVPGGLRPGDADGQADGQAGPEAPPAEPDRSRHDADQERSKDASDGDVQAAAEAALVAHGFGPGAIDGDDRQPRHAGRGPDFAPAGFVSAEPPPTDTPPAEQHDETAERRLNIFAPPPTSPAGRATPAAAAINIFAPPPGTRSRDTAQREAGRTGKLFSRTAATTASMPARDAWLAHSAPEDEDSEPAPRPNGAHRPGGPGNGTGTADRHDTGRPDRSVNVFAAPRTATPQMPTPQPATPPPALRREPGPAAAAWDSPADEAVGEARPAGGRPGTGRPGAPWKDGLDDVDKDTSGTADRDTADAAAWNDGLREPPRPPRARPNEERSRFSALLARLGGRRAAEPEPTEMRPDAPSMRDDGGDAGPADLAERAGATSVADLLAVAAAWLTLVEGKPRFTRREVMETFERLPGNHPRTLEARIKGFGKLVRSSILILVDDGVFAMAQAERERYQAMIDDG